VVEAPALWLTWDEPGDCPGGVPNTVPDPPGEEVGDVSSEKSEAPSSRVGWEEVCLV
jgi:hypothetical protein